MKNKEQQQQNTEEIDLMSIKLKLIQNLGLTYIQASKVIKHIKDEMVMNEVDECDWIEEMFGLKNKINNNKKI